MPRSRQCFDTLQAARHASAAAERPQECGQVAFLVSVDRWCLRTCAGRPWRPNTGWLRELPRSRQFTHLSGQPRAESHATRRCQPSARAAIARSWTTAPVRAVTMAAFMGTIYFALVHNRVFLVRCRVHALHYVCYRGQMRSALSSPSTPPAP